jgi:hypothetical protein
MPRVVSDSAGAGLPVSGFSLAFFASSIGEDSPNERNTSEAIQYTE